MGRLVQAFARGASIAIATTTLIVLAAVGPCWAAGSDDAPSPDAPPKRWAFEFNAPIWVPGNYGTLTAKDHVAHIDVSPNDTWNILTSGNAFAGEGYFDFRYDRVFTFVDAVGGYVQEGVSERVPIKQYPRLGNLAVDARLKLKNVLADFAIGYRLGTWTLPNRRRPFTLDVYAGARYYWFLTELKASASIAKAGLRQAVDVSKTFDWADPLVGVRWQAPLLDCVSMNFRADIGGFDAGSELSWNLVTDLRYWPNLTILSAQPYVALGYRALGFKRSANAGNELDIQFRGPLGSAGFVF